MSVTFMYRWHEAICDVESALVTLDSTVQRSADAFATNGFERSYQAIEVSYEADTSSLFELEDTRRNMVAAQNAVIDLRRERISAWIALYRAIGGGGSNDQPSSTPEL